MDRKSADTNLELSGDQFRRMVEEVVEHLAVHLDSLPDQAVWNTDGAAEVARSVIERIPQHGQPLEQILETFFGRLVPVSYTTPSPGYLYSLTSLISDQ